MSLAPPRGAGVVTCPGCDHPINEHTSTEASANAEGVNGCSHPPAFDDEPVCECKWTPNDIAYRRGGFTYG